MVRDEAIVMKWMRFMVEEKRGMKGEGELRKGGWEESPSARRLLFAKLS